MADLDNFFAKKDKKKKSKGKKYSSKTPQTLVDTPQQLSEDDTTSKDVKINIPASQSKDEEWVEETEIVEDLEGLKVAPLKAEGTDKGALTRDNNTEQDTDTQSNYVSEKSGSKQVASPWQLPSTEEPENNTDDDGTETTELLVHTTEALTSQGKYVPPSRRGQGSSMASSSNTSRPRYGGRNRPPPDLQNTMAFPSLQSSVPK